MTAKLNHVDYLSKDIKSVIILELIDTKSLTDSSSHLIHGCDGDKLIVRGSYHISTRSTIIYIGI